MPLPDIKNVGVVASFTRWGCPWHGLAEGGVITASGRALTQPATGDVYVLKISGAPVSSQTPSEVAADAALGMSWLNYVVISGSNQQIYGSKNLGPFGWIYASPDGRRWWIKMTSGVTASANAHTFTFLIKLFGEFHTTVVTETYTRTVTVSDLGQSTPYAKLSHWVTGETLCELNNYRFYLEDTSRTGARAILALRNITCASALLGTAGSTDWRFNEPIPMGFLSIDVTDGMLGPNISVSVLYNRGTTLGTFDGSNGWKTDNRILAAVFSDGGAVLPLKVSMDFPRNFVTGTTPCPGSLTNSSTATFAWKLDWGSTALNYSAALSGTSTVNCTEISPGNYTLSGSNVGSYTAFGVLLVGSYSSPNNSSYAGVSFGITIYWQNQTGGTQATPPGAYPGSGFFDFVGTSSTGDQFFFAVKRISNKHFGLIAMKSPNNSDTTIDSNNMVWIGGITPSGADGLTGNLGVLTQIIPLGTTHPFTHVPVLHFSTVPLCYV